MCWLLSLIIDSCYWAFNSDYAGLQLWREYIVKNDEFSSVEQPVSAHLELANLKNVRLEFPVAFHWDRVCSQPLLP